MDPSVQIREIKLEVCRVLAPSTAQDQLGTWSTPTAARFFKLRKADRSMSMVT